MDNDGLIFVLVDEIESLATNRALTLSEANPVDVFRAVNAAIDELDRLTHYNNIFLIATSNLPRAVDLAFIDRADIKIFFDMPNVEIRKQIIEDTIDALAKIYPDLRNITKHAVWRKCLKRLAREFEGFSPREIRKIIREAMIEIFISSNELTIGKLVNMMISAIRHEQKRKKKDQEHGGIYEYFHKNLKKKVGV